MKSFKHSLKRTLASVLALTMVLSLVEGGWFRTVSAEDAVTVSYGKVVADNFEGLSEAEKEILRSGLLVGNSFTYQVPAGDNSDGLIKVDAAKKTLKVENYTDTEGNIWKADEVRIVNDEGIQERVSLTDGKGSFTYDGKSYTVEVDYQLTKTVDAELMRKLLNAPYQLSQGVANLDSLADSDVETALATLSDSPQFLACLKTIAEGVPFAGGWLDFPEASAQAEALYKQCKENEGGKLDLELLIDAYKAADSKAAYLVENGTEVQNVNQDTLENLKAVHSFLASPTNQSLIILSGVEVTKGELNAAVNTLATAIEGMTPAAEDSWSILSAGALRTDLTAADYQQLDSLVAAYDLAAAEVADGTEGPYDEAELPAELVVKIATVKCNINRYTITVKVQAQVVDTITVDSAVLTSLAEQSVSLEMTEGATGAEIRTAIAESGVEALALEAWDSRYEINQTNYLRTEDPDLSAEDYKLAGDITCVISYVPRDLTITYGEGYEEGDKVPTTVPYGYQMTLPKYGAGQVYDYKVNGTAKDQGAVIRITGNTSLSRTAGKTWESHGLGALIAENYAAEDEAALAILSSPALLTGSFRLRTPAEQDGLLDLRVEGTEYVVTAEAYKAHTEDLWWVPESGVLVGGADDGEAVSFVKTGSDYVARIPQSADFEKVSVQYRVELSWDALGKTPEEAREILNLPHVLTQEAASQLRAMDRILEKYDSLASINSNLNAIVTAVNGADNLPEVSKQAMKDVAANCKNPVTKDLYLYEYLTAYKALSSDGERLAFYYKNYAGEKGIKAQIERLNQDLRIVTVENRESFEQFLLDMDDGKADGKYSSYLSKMDSILERMQEVLTDLKEPNAAININSTSLNTLAALIADNRGNTRAYEAALTEQPSMTTVLSVDAPNKISVTIQVQVESSDGDVLKTKTASLTFSTEEGSLILGAADIARLNELLDSLKVDLDMAHLNLKSGEMPEAGTELAGSTQVSFVWEPLQYTVLFENEEGNGAGSTNFYYDAPVVDLPACTESGLRYKYVIDGTETAAASYTFTGEQLDRLFADGPYTIVRKTIDINRENVETLTSKLNQTLMDQNLTFIRGGKACLIAAFIPVEDSQGKLSVVLRLSPQRMELKGELVTAIGESLLNAGIPYIGLDGETFFEDDTMHLQAIVDAALNSGFGLDTVGEVIGEDGNIVELELPGTVIGAENNTIIVGEGCINDASLLGGKLFDTMLRIGDTQETGLDVPLYVTLEDFDLRPEQLKSVRNAAQKVSGYGTMKADEGVLQSELKLTDRMYQACLTALLASDQATLSDLTAIDPVGVVHYLYDMAVPVLEDESVTGETLNNTLDKLGVDINLPGYDRVSRILRSLLKDISAKEEEGNTDTYKAVVHLDLTRLIEKLNLSAVSGMIAERETGLDIPVSVKVDNLNKSYQALVIDLKAAGAGKLRYYSDAASLQTAVSGNNAPSLVILLSDLEGDLTVDNRGILLDLNGCTINGSLTGEARVMVVDSSANNAGGVEGGVSGNVTLTAGNYAADISSFLPEGYSQQADGSVANSLYSWLEDENGNYTLAVNGDILKLESMPSIRSMALEVAYDLLLKHYTCASLTMDAYPIYNVTVEDLLALAKREGDAEDVNKLLGILKADGVTGFANDLIAALTDFEAISAAMAVDGKIKTYTMQTAPWTVQVRRQEEGDYLTADILPGEDVFSRTVTLQILDNEDGDFAALVEKLAEVAKVDSHVTLNQPVYADKQVSVSGDASVDVVLDLSEDPSYAAIVAVILADSLEGAQKEALTSAVAAYLETGKTEAIKEAVEQVTTGQLLTALKGMERESFAAAAARLGLTGLEEAAALEEAYDDLLVLAGNALSYLKINGGGRKLGSFEAAGQYGVYTASKTYSRQISRDVRSYTAVAEAEVSVSLTVKLFKEEIQDAVVVEDTEGSVLYSGNSLDEAFAAVTAGSTMTIYEAVQLNGDVILNTVLTIVGAEKMDLNGHTITLGSTEAVLTADADLSAAVEAGVTDYEVKAVSNEGQYTYSLSAVVYPVTVTSGETVLYKGSSLTEAFAAAAAGSIITVNKAVALEAGINLSTAVTLKGADKIDLNGQKITLSSTGAALTADADLSAAVEAGVTDYEVKAVSSEGQYTYSLSAIVYPVTVTSGETVLYKGSSLTEAFAAATAGSIITVNKAVALDAGINLNTAVTLRGAEKMDLNGQKITLSSTEAVLTADADLSAAVEAGVTDYEVKTVNNEGMYTFSLSAIVYPITVTKGETVLYKGSSLTEAFTAATMGSTITVNEAVTLEQDVTVSADITLLGVSKINQNGKKINLAIGGSLTTDGALNVTTSEAYYTVVRSGQTYQLSALKPAFTGAVQVTLNDAIRGSKVKNGYIFLDVDPTGISESQLTGCLKIPANNASKITMKVVSGLKNGKVVNGAVLSVKASNPAYAEDVEVRYTIIIMGDTNCNGETDSGDAALMVRSYVNGYQMSEVAKLAADMNQNGELDSGDAAKNATKYTNLWTNGTYKSALK